VGALDAALADLVPVELKRDIAALADPAAVVGEFHAHLVAAGRQRRVAADGV